MTPPPPPKKREGTRVIPGERYHYSANMNLPLAKIKHRSTLHFFKCRWQYQIIYVKFIFFAISNAFEVRIEQRFSFQLPQMPASK